MSSAYIEHPFIKNPFTMEMLKLFDTLRYKKTNFNVQSCALITGESGSGKSGLAKFFLKKNPVIEQSQRTYIPVFYFKVISVSKAEYLLKSILVELDDPQMGEGDTDQRKLLTRLVTLLKSTGVELIIIDEIQVVFERRSAKIISGIADLFKDLIEESKIPIVFMGMPWSTYLVESNSQLSTRISHRHTIPPYKISDNKSRDDYRRLLHFVSSAYGFTESIKLEEVSTAFRFFSATSGNLKLTLKLIQDAFIQQKMTGEKVGNNLFADIIKSYGVIDECNPFLLPVERLVLRELVTHSDFHFGYRANKNAIIDAEYIEFGVSKSNKLYVVNNVA
ncbi:AAA family ATPase [Microbulbifer sp. SH-1]|uniref:TniB family NTP-binding protein n=1 Tax=Microbulbifer sp. SH-1 TaxID=2681547 RepID=UPI001409F100|nr:TniB family NTP-binding protein [Microbulbifer sp. SH-1]QIL91248.1 AAA family ATPase [Microbulbifer sp. SH-1]